MNAKEEMLYLLEGKKIKCAIVERFRGYGKKPKTIKLKNNHSKADLDKFLNKLDFEYDDGFGGQYLFGTVWFKDGTWADRGEYDGSEWWAVRETPKIPKKLK